MKIRNDNKNDNVELSVNESGSIDVCVDGVQAQEDTSNPLRRAQRDDSTDIENNDDDTDDEEEEEEDHDDSPGKDEDAPIILAAALGLNHIRTRSLPHLLRLGSPPRPGLHLILATRLVRRKHGRQSPSLIGPSLIPTRTPSNKVCSS